MLLLCPAPAFVPKCAACICMHGNLRCVCVPVCVCANVKACFWSVNLHLSFSLSSLQACSRWSVKASTASLLIEDASRLLWCPAGTAAADRCQREGDRGRHRTYNNSGGNKFEKWGNTLAHRNHSITYFNNVKEEGRLFVSVCEREEESGREKHPRQRGKKGGGLELVPVPTEGEGSQYFCPLFFYHTSPSENWNN